jgi:hypothetical protein
MADIIEMVTGAEDSSANLSKLAEEDSNAVPARHLPEHVAIGRLLSAGSEGEKVSGVLRVMELSFAPTFVGLLAYFPQIYADRAGMAEPNSLLYISGLVTAAAGPAAAAFSLRGFHESLRPNGPLHQLLYAGADTAVPDAATRISEAAAALQARWRVVLWALCMPMTLFWAAIGFGAMAGNATTAAGVAWGVLFGVQHSMWCILVFGWWSSFRLASCLCRDATVEVVRACHETDPADDAEWRRSVEAPALALNKTFQVLSNGWSRALACVSCGAFFLSFAMLGLAVNDAYVAARPPTHCPARARGG